MAIRVDDVSTINYIVSEAWLVFGFSVYSMGRFKKEEVRKGKRVIRVKVRIIQSDVLCKNAHGIMAA